MLDIVIILAKRSLHKHLTNIMSQAIHLSSIPTLPTTKISKEEAIIETIRLTKKLKEIQDKLHAQGKYSVLIILQGMDTSGKDNTVKNVFSGVNPAGCNVTSFKVPTQEEKAHHFLWRIANACPAKGMIHIFNRSHYEDILVPKVNSLLSPKKLKVRCDEINTFEMGLIMADTILLKFYLNISHIEQLKRLESRKMDPTKRWKLNPEDTIDIAKHSNFKKAYEYVFKNCSDSSPWQVIPADKKWYKNYLILDKIVNELKKYTIDYPTLKLKDIQ